MRDKPFNFRKKLYILSSNLVVYFSVSVDKSSNLVASEIFSFILLVYVEMSSKTTARPFLNRTLELSVTREILEGV